MIGIVVTKLAFFCILLKLNVKKVFAAMAEQSTVFSINASNFVKFA